MIRVLHLRSTDRVCGPGKTILESCNWINRKKYDLSIGLLTSLPESEHPLYQSAFEKRIPVTAIRSTSRFGPGQVKAIVDLVRNNKIDIIHTHEYKSDILGFIASKMTGAKIVTTAHGWISNNYRSKVYLWIGKNLLRWFDYIVAVSPRIKAEILAHGVSEHKVELIYNAIVIENYDPSVVDAGYLREKFSIPPGARIVGNIGRISPEKGQKDFVHAAEATLRQRDDACFIMIGDGPDLMALRKYVVEKGLQDKVFFTGYERNIRSVYRDLDVLALTSFSEGFPNVILEALCMGVPVLATSVGGVPDIVRDGETGILVEPGNIQAISNGLEQLLSDRLTADKLVRKGRKVIASQFGFVARMSRIESVYDRVVSSV